MARWILTRGLARVLATGVTGDGGEFRKMRVVLLEKVFGSPL
jgi:hypothetical protein